MSNEHSLPTISYGIDPNAELCQYNLEHNPTGDGYAPFIEVLSETEQSELQASVDAENAVEASFRLNDKLGVTRAQQLAIMHSSMIAECAEATARGETTPITDVERFGETDTEREQNATRLINEVVGAIDMFRVFGIWLYDPEGAVDQLSGALDLSSAQPFDIF